MNPRLDTLPPPQRRLWPELRATPRRFVLYGGTAIALRLAHRESEDFDFFSSEPFDGDALLAEIPYLKDATVVQRAQRHTDMRGRSPWTGSCVLFPEGFRSTASVRRRPPRAWESWSPRYRTSAAPRPRSCKPALSPRTISTLTRLSGWGAFPLAAMLGAATAIHGERYNAMLTLKALAYFGDGDLAELPAAVRKRLSLAAATMDPGSIPRYEPLPGIGPPSPRQ